MTEGSEHGFRAYPARAEPGRRRDDHARPAGPAQRALRPDASTSCARRSRKLAGSGARCLLLTGEGRGFSSGADLAGGGGLPDDVGAALEKHFNPLIEALFALPIPVVAAVNGPCAGAGCSLALAADIVIAARSAYFLQAFVNIGLIPDAGATWLLPRLAGRARAMEMMMLGERIPAEQALEWGHDLAGRRGRGSGLGSGRAGHPPRAGADGGATA